jgi:hypothetical protein
MRSSFFVQATRASWILYLVTQPNWNFEKVRTAVRTAVRTVTAHHIMHSISTDEVWSDIERLNYFWRWRMYVRLLRLIPSNPVFVTGAERRKNSRNGKAAPRSHHPHRINNDNSTSIGTLCGCSWLYAKPIAKSLLVLQIPRTKQWCSPRLVPWPWWPATSKASTSKPCGLSPLPNPLWVKSRLSVCPFEILTNETNCAISYFFLLF